MKLNHQFYHFCPDLLVPEKWGEMLKECLTTEDMETEIPEDFYLYILGSISLQGKEKVKVFLQVNELTELQVSELLIVLKEEIREFEKPFNEEKYIMLQLICDNLFSATATLRLYGLIETPREENKILKKIASQWLSNDATSLQQIEQYQDEFPCLKQILRYYYK